MKKSSAMCNDQKEVVIRQEAIGEAHKASKQACYVIGEEWAACRPLPAHVRSYRSPLITFPINYGQLKAERCHFSGYRRAADTGTTGTCPAAARRGFLCRGSAGVTGTHRLREGAAGLWRDVIEFMFRHRTSVSYKGLLV